MKGKGKARVTVGRLPGTKRPATEHPESSRQGAFHRPAVVCFKCGKPGHSAVDCRSKVRTPAGTAAREAMNARRPTRGAHK